MIISGERRYHAARAAGLRELPCIEKDVDDAETLELALIENLQRKDLTPFEEADGVQALVDRFSMTHEDVAKKIGKARSSVTELLSVRSIPDAIKAQCIEKGVLSKSQLLQVARQPTEAKMQDLVRRFALGMINRDQARAERHPEKKPQKAIFRFVPPSKEFTMVLQFRKNSLQREDVIQALRRIIEALEAEARTTA
jgi:ParB family chromosome partitioning protein